MRPLSFAIGLRFIRSKNRHYFLSFISWVSMLGLVLGVATLIVIMSVLNGFEQALTGRILGAVPQASVYFGEPIEDWQKIATQLQSADGNIAGIAPFVQTRGMTAVAGKVQGTILTGIIPSFDDRVSILNHSMVQGSLQTLKTGSRNIVLGQALVDDLGLRLGDEVNIIIATPSSSVVGMTPRFEHFYLSGVFHISKEVDKWLSYVSMNDASDVIGIAQGATGLRLRLNDVFLAEKSASQAVNQLGTTMPNTIATTWRQTHGSLYDSIEMQKTMIGLLLFLVILVAGFNIISTLMMMVTDKRSEIAILKTLGASSFQIMQIFIAQGLLIGVVGTLTGAMLGIGISFGIEGWSRWLNETFELNLFDSYFVESLPSVVRVLDIVVIVLASIFVSLLATLYPAFKASQVEPAKALRYE